MTLLEALEKAKEQLNKHFCGVCLKEIKIGDELVWPSGNHAECQDYVHKTFARSEKET